MPFDPSPTYPLVEPNRTELEPWRQVLLDAAQLIREHGWQRLHMGNDGGPHCAFGAMMAVSDGHPREAINRLQSHLAGGRPGGSIICWNDAPGRTSEEVASTMERVALSGRRE